MSKILECFAIIVDCISGCFERVVACSPVFFGKPQMLTTNIQRLNTNKDTLTSVSLSINICASLFCLQLRHRVHSFDLVICFWVAVVAP